MGPLKGIRVLDLSLVVSGPFCTMMLGDLGADVIKIEPPEGDVSRYVTADSRNGVGVSIINYNRNKRAMLLDLKRPGASEVFLRMAERADAVVQNFRPGVVDKLGIGYAATSARNRKIVYCSIAGYGFTGPYADKPAYDPIIQGLAGVMASQRTQGRPRAVKNIIADKVTSMTAAYSITAALLAARNGGAGQHIEIAMMDAVAYFLMPDTMAQPDISARQARHAALDGYARTVPDRRRIHHDRRAPGRSVAAAVRSRRPSRMVRGRRAAQRAAAARDQGT